MPFSARASGRWTPSGPSPRPSLGSDGVLTAVGSDPEIRELIGPGTEVIDGAGLSVVPGLVDSHIHPFHGTLVTRGVDLRGASSIDEVRSLLAAERRRCGPDTWVLGHSVRYEPFHDSGIRADAIAGRSTTCPL